MTAETVGVGVPSVPPDYAGDVVSCQTCGRAAPVRLLQEWIPIECSECFIARIAGSVSTVGEWDLLFAALLGARDELRATSGRGQLSVVDGTRGPDQ